MVPPGIWLSRVKGHGYEGSRDMVDERYGCQEIWLSRVKGHDYQGSRDMVDEGFGCQGICLSRDLVIKGQGIWLSRDMFVKGYLCQGICLSRDWLLRGCYIQASNVIPNFLILLNWECVRITSLSCATVSASLSPCMVLCLCCW